VAHTVIADNAGGHLMQTGRVDLVLTGSDRTTSRGDVCNKIGTYLKALAARESGLPFYVALPTSSIDWGLVDGAEVPIEERSGDELRRVRGRSDDGRLVEVEILPAASPAANYAFDVTPAHLVTALVTERGLCDASAEGLRRLRPESIDSWERSSSSRHPSATSRT
jgi:methylthioribose-1-phosphate isomerase